MVVDDMDKALTFWRDALGLEMSELRDVPAEQAQVAFLPASDSEVELVLPTSADSGMGKYLAKRGPGMHHICVEVDDIVAMLTQLKDKGIRLINEEPRSGAGGYRYAFVHPESTAGVLVELYQL
jgi:methylmalonyl-CoA/ethylmalonyl-CoA epimerase